MNFKQEGVDMLSDALRRLRIEKGYSQAYLSKKCNLPRTTYRDIESGKVKNPTLFQICRLCIGLEITPNELIPEYYYKR